jgi:FixJ family two-component response regulator
MKHEPTVFVIDDDAAIRDALSVLLKTSGLHCQSFATAETFLAALTDTRPVCALVDVCLPGMNGLELQRQLSCRGIEATLMVMTGQGTVPIAVEAMRAGALHFIEKPLDPETLLEVINDAFIRHSALAEQCSMREQTRLRLEALTPREREVLDLLVEGHLNKVIAGRLGISTRTAEHHRAHIMAKMGARTLSHLIRMSLGVPTPAARPCR